MEKWREHRITIDACGYVDVSFFLCNNFTQQETGTDICAYKCNEMPTVYIVSETLNIQLSLILTAVALKQL